MDPDSCFLTILLLESHSFLNPNFAFSVGFLVEIISLITLLFISGFFSGAETAFFAVTQAQLVHLKQRKNSVSKIVAGLLEYPKRLLATLLITINFVNLAIIVLSSLLIAEVFDFSFYPLLGFLIQVVAVTFVIVLFCEVMPKIYATQNALRFSHFSAYPVFVLDKILRPFSTALVVSTSMIDKRINQKGYEVSMDELTHAIEITSDKNTPLQEKNILKGIARFGNIDVKQIMKARMDVLSFNRDMKFNELFPLIIENRYSRIPVFAGTFDTIIGVLYLKDLLPYLDREQDASFDWLKLLRPAYFVPESKKINDLLQEFQEKKIHLAIVIDEFGGSSGIVALEDILEEIVGEINDEFDDDELLYSKLDDFNFVFEGKTLLNDVCRVMEIDRKLFHLENEEVETLAGFLLELKGGIPQRSEVIQFNNISFTIESADRRRIKRVKINLPPKTDQAPEHPQRSGSEILPVILALFIASMSMSACNDDYVPKPRGYFRIAFPAKSYSTYIPEKCPYQFDIPGYAIPVPDSEVSAEPCWMNVEFAPFRGTLYLSYKQVDNNLSKYIEDSRALTLKHIPKASGIDEEMINYPDKKVHGQYYYIKGNAASAVQFFLTDSTKHFIRGSLYFYAVPNPDSIAPVLEFIEKDIHHLVETFHWK